MFRTSPNTITTKLSSHYYIGRPILHEGKKWYTVLNRKDILHTSEPSEYFETKEEAQKYCDEMNAEIKGNEHLGQWRETPHKDAATHGG